MLTVILPESFAPNQWFLRPIDAGEFPPAPKGKVGWPWECPGRSQTTTKDQPLISVVTPSFNQGRFLEETIRSVLLQGYPNLQYIVVDGGSSDESVSILHKYEPWLAYWVSECDRGQPHAINKGLQMARGSVFGFLNSDDLLMPEALLSVGEAHARFPHSLIAGDVLEFRQSLHNVVQRVDQSGLSFEAFIQICNQPNLHQPVIFVPRELFDEIGLFDESQHFGFDYEFICRALYRTDAHLLDKPLAAFRLHTHSKTGQNEVLLVREQLRSSRRFWHLLERVDRAGYRRFAAEQLFCAGCSRLLHGREFALSLMMEGLTSQPFWAITAALRQWPLWVSRQLNGNQGSNSR